MLAVSETTFDPVLLSRPENEFVIAHVGKAPAVVRTLPFPAGVNPNAVLPVIERVYDLIEVEKANGAPWIGVAAVQAAAQTYLTQLDEWDELRRKNAHNTGWPKYPTMAGWDTKGKAALGATGSDAGQVRTYFDEHGDRRPLAISLHDTEQATFLPPWIKQTVQHDSLIVDDAQGFVRCPVCQHTETYNNESQSARNMAQGRMAKHLLGAKTHVEAHRDLHTKAYGR